MLRINPPGGGLSGPGPVDEVRVEEHEGAYLVSRPAVGALSAVDTEGLVALHLYVESQGDANALDAFFTQIYGEEEGARRAREFAERMARDGWDRTRLPEEHAVPLASVYFTVTRSCNLACPYCYQGHQDRAGTEMSLEVASAVLDRVHAVNPACQLNITGGEPLSHPGLFEILELVEQRGFSHVLLTNGSFLSRDVARRLGRLSGLRYVHLSMDGLTAESHGRTRVGGKLASVMAALDALVAEGIGFVLAPTIHAGNLSELPAMAELAFRKGGWISPNQLRQFPHAGLDFSGLEVGVETVLETLRVINAHLIERFGQGAVEERAARFSEQVLCAAPRPNTRFVCGMAYSLIDVDWNGEVYPCHLLKDRELVLGNLAEESWEEILRRSEERGLRVRSYEIPRCSTCTFVSTCGGGCRAGAWYHFGTLQHEDDACEINYAARVRRAVRTVARRL